MDCNVRAAVHHYFTVNILFWDNIDAGTVEIYRNSNAHFVIDQMAILQSHTPPAPPKPWADISKVHDLAKRKNALVKVSRACTLSREPHRFNGIWYPLPWLYDAWGFERCLWRTHWTSAHAVVNYEQSVRPFIATGQITDDERAMLMGEACTKGYA